MSDPATLDDLAAELEAVADKLRSGAVDADEAADLVDRCAELAVQLGAALDARAREADASAGQERLL